MYTVAQKLKQLGIKSLRILWAVTKGILSFAGNLTVIVIGIIVIFAIARVVFPVEVATEAEEAVTTAKSGVEARPVYELAGEEIPGTVSAYESIDGWLREGAVVDPYSKIGLNPKRNWDIHDKEAVGNPGYIRYGFLPFNQIVDLSEGDILAFPNINFGTTAPVYISMQIAKTAGEGGAVSVYADDLSEKSLLAIFDVTEVSMGSGKTDFFQVTEKIGRGKEITGIHKIYIRVEQEGISVGQIRFGR